MTTDDLSDHAFAVLDGYWTLCSPTEALLFFVDEYLEYSERNHPFQIGDETLTDRDVITVLSELLAYFASRNDDGNEVVVTSLRQQSSLLNALATYVGRKRMK